MARILVVDDNLLNRRLVADLLTIEGHEVCCCEDAEQVFREVGSGELPDLVLMDISLPGMDGLTLTRHLKADARFASIPILAVTAFAMKGDEQKALQAGCAGYITKPIDTRRLPQEVMRHLSTVVRADPLLNVMIVEDHRIDLKLAADRVRLSGHLVLDSTSAEDAIERLERSRPDVVLLDLSLPGMDGLAFVRRLKQDPDTSALPIVAITAFPDAYRRQEMLDAGCAAYLVKPVDMGELLRQIEGAVRPKA